MQNHNANESLNKTEITYSYCTIYQRKYQCKSKNTYIAQHQAKHAINDNEMELSEEKVIT